MDTSAGQALKSEFTGSYVVQQEAARRKTVADVPNSGRDCKVLEGWEKGSCPEATKRITVLTVCSYFLGLKGSGEPTPCPYLMRRIW